MEVKLLNKFIIILLVVLWIYLIINRSKFFLHMMQLEGYENNNYRKWILESDKAYSIRLKKIYKTSFYHYDNLFNISFIDQQRSTV